mgnify:CR=1 FL=1
MSGHARILYAPSQNRYSHLVDRTNARSIARRTAAHAPAGTFHLVEREFGRFARAVRLTGAFNVRQANAALQDGQLTIRLPKMEDRRGQAFRIPIAAGSVAP